MPIYDYVCTECKKTFDKFVRSSHEHEVVECPSCQSTKTVRQLSHFAVGSPVAKSSPGGCCQHCCGDDACAME